MAHATSAPGMNSVSASKSEMKLKKKHTLTEISIRKEQQGFTVMEQYDSPDSPMCYESPKRFAFSTEAEAVKKVLSCIKDLGEKRA